MDMARFEIPVSGWTCLRTVATRGVSHGSDWKRSSRVSGRSQCSTTTKGDAEQCKRRVAVRLTLVDVGGVCLLASLGALLLVA